MAQPGTVPVSAPIDTYAAANTYPTHFANRGKGGYMTVADTTQRDAISALRREEGMVVFVISDGTEYRLDADLTTWVAQAGSIDPNTLMLKSVYDPNDDGVVTNSDNLQGHNGAYYLNRSNHTGTQAQSTVTNLVSDLAGKESIAALGTNGHAAGPLSGGLIPLSQIPFTSSAYKGLYNASTNSPVITNGVGTAGDFYIASATGSAGPVTVTTLNQIVAYNGSIWQVGAVFTGGIASVVTDTGTQTGPTVTIDDTSYIAPSTDRNYATDDQKDAMDNATTPSASNPFATITDVQAAIVVGNTLLTPELYADGQTLGDGTLRTLSSLGYNNTTAGNYWTRVNSAYTINVNTMSIDWIAWQEACLAMEQGVSSAIYSPGAKGYCFSQDCDLPRDMAAYAQYQRSKKFIFKFNGSMFANRTGAPMHQFNVYPADQTEANGFRLVYGYSFEDATFFGANLASNNAGVANDCAIRVGARSGCMFTNLNIEESGIGIDLQFGLEANFYNVSVADFGKYGIRTIDGLWTGAGVNNAQSNNVTMTQYHSYSGSGKTPTASLYVQGSRNLSLDTATFEGANGSVHHIFYNQFSDVTGVPATTVPNHCYLKNLDFEAAGASRSAIRINSGGGQAVIDTFNIQQSPSVMPVFVEHTGDIAPVHITVKGQAYYNPGWKFKETAPTGRWYISMTTLNNNTNPLAAANWDTTSGGIIPAGSAISYTPIL